MDQIKKICKWFEEFKPLVQFGMIIVAVILFSYGVYTLRSWWIDRSPVVEFLVEKLAQRRHGIMSY